METKNIHEALFMFQGKVAGVARDSTNPHFKSKYASLEAVWNTIRPILQECGLYVVQCPGPVSDGCLSLITSIVHASDGNAMETKMQIPLAKGDPQGYGSALTYAQRYSLMAMLGLPPTDDDGELACLPATNTERVIEKWGDRRGAELTRAVSAGHATRTRNAAVQDEEFPE